MVCASCGSAINTGASFCSNCGRPVAGAGYATNERKLIRPIEGRRIAGVCAGISLYTGWDLTLVRLVAVLAAVFGVGMPVLAYVIGWAVMPEASVGVYPQA
jgi:phage shock protein C